MLFFRPGAGTVFHPARRKNLQRNYIILWLLIQPSRIPPIPSPYPPLPESLAITAYFSQPLWGIPGKADWSDMPGTGPGGYVRFPPGVLTGAHIFSDYLHYNRHPTKKRPLLPCFPHRQAGLFQFFKKPIAVEEKGMAGICSLQFPRHTLLTLKSVLWIVLYRIAYFLFSRRLSVHCLAPELLSFILPHFSG